MSEFYISEIANKSLFYGAGLSILLVPFLLIIAFGYFSFGLSRSSIEIDGSNIVINAPFYGRQISEDDLIKDGVKNVTIEKGLLSYRTNGISFFGVNLGWYKNSSGRKILAFVTNANDLVFIPTKLDFDLVVSVKKSNELINILQGKVN